VAQPLRARAHAREARQEIVDKRFCVDTAGACFQR
jgi:hypothetical protein